MVILLFRLACSSCSSDATAEASLQVKSALPKASSPPLFIFGFVLKETDSGWMGMPFDSSELCLRPFFRCKARSALSFTILLFRLHHHLHSTIPPLRRGHARIPPSTLARFSSHLIVIRCAPPFRQSTFSSSDSIPCRWIATNLSRSTTLVLLQLNRLHTLRSIITNTEPFSR